MNRIYYFFSGIAFVSIALLTAFVLSLTNTIKDFVKGSSSGIRMKRMPANALDEKTIRAIWEISTFFSSSSGV